METIAKILLLIHILSGFTALIFGGVALLTQKGRRVHTLSGRVFFWAMFGVFVTTLPLTVIHPNLFLFLVGVFSFYMAFTGYRVLQIGKMSKGQKASGIDWLVSGLTLVAGIFMLFHGFLSLPQLTFLLNPVLLVFGAICTGFAWKDLQFYRKKPADKNAWLFIHIIRMCGAFIATVTAFMVVNVTFLPELVVWLGPTAVGSIGIGYALRKYKKKPHRPQVVA